MTITPVLLSLLANLRGDAASSVSSAGQAFVQTPTQAHPFCFLENRGQWPDFVRFIARASNMVVRAEQDALVLVMPDSSGDPALEVLVRIEFGATADSGAVGENLVPGLNHYLIGNDQSKWTRDVHRFERVRYPCVASGIDLVLREQDGNLEYDLEVDADANLSTLVFECKGVERLELDGDGSLLLRTALGTLRQPPPKSEVLLQDGTRREALVRFQIVDDHRFAFESADSSRGLALHIDPGLLWSTYVGSSGAMGGSEYFLASAVDAQGSVTLTGRATGFDFPTTPGAIVAMPPGGSPVIVTKFDSSGTLVYSTTIGAEGGSEGRAIALDSLGRATVAGTLINGALFVSTFPTTPGAFDRVMSSGGISGFALRLNEAGTSLVFSTFIEGTGNGTLALAVDVASSGATVVGGYTSSSAFPVTPGAFITSYLGSQDGFVTRLDPTGSFLEWSTFLGGSNGDDVRALKVDSSNNVTVVGLTGSFNFPVTSGAYKQTLGPGAGSFVTRLNAQGSGLIWSTFLAGPAPFFTNYATATALDLEPAGGVVVIGTCLDPTFPTTPGALFPANPASSTTHSFVTRLDPTGSSLIYSTLLSFAAVAQDVVVDPSGVATVTGIDFNSTMPTTPGSYNPSHTNWRDAFVARINPTGTKFYYSSMFGSPGHDVAFTLASINSHVVALGGAAEIGMPTTPGAFDPTFNGGLGDAFVAAFDLFLQGARPYGNSTPACNGGLIMNVTRMPSAGAANFGLYCSAAPPNSNGWLILGSEALAPTLVQGASMHLDPSKRIWRVSVQSNANGFVETPFPLTGIPTGTHFAAQYIFGNTVACPGAGTFSASNAVLIDVQ